MFDTSSTAFLKTESSEYECSSVDADAVLVAAAAVPVARNTVWTIVIVDVCRIVDVGSPIVAADTEHIVVKQYVAERTSHSARMGD